MHSLVSGLVAFSVGLAGGAVFMALSIPLPWLLGSLAATALLSLGLRRNLALSGRWRDLAIVVIGIMLGEGFTAEIVSGALAWWPSLLLMAVLSVAFFYVSYAFMRRFTNLDRTTNVLSSLPGGIALATALAPGYGADGKRVALAHFSRITIILAVAPAILTGNLEGPVPAMLPVHTPTSMGELAMLAAAAAVAYVVGGRTGIPSGLLIVALVISALLHGAGIVTGSAPPVLAIIAQVLLGASIGIRFGSYSWQELFADVRLSAIIGLTLVALAGGAAYLGSLVLGKPFASLFLSFLPGGIPEMGILALALDIDPAMVVTHHLFRILVLLVLLHLVLRRTPRGEQPANPKV